MGLLLDLYERLLRKLHIQKSEPSTRNSSLKRSKSVTKDNRERTTSRTRNPSMSVRGRSNTEVTIEKKRISRGNSLQSDLALSRRIRSSTVGNTEIIIRTRSSPSVGELPIPIVLPRMGTGPAHRNIVSSGSLLAPTYKSRIPKSKVILFAVE